MTWRLLLASHTITDESSDAEQNRLGASLAREQELTMPLWSVYFLARQPLLASHRATVLSAEHESRRAPSPDHCTSSTAFLCPLSTL